MYFDGTNSQWEKPSGTRTESQVSVGAKKWKGIVDGILNVAENTKFSALFRTMTIEVVFRTNMILRFVQNCKM